MKKLIIFIFSSLLFTNCSKGDKSILVSFELKDQEKHQWFDSIINYQDTIKNDGLGFLELTILTKDKFGQTLSTNFVGVEQPLSDSLSNNVLDTSSTETFILKDGDNLTFVIAATKQYLIEPNLNMLKVKVDVNGIKSRHRNLEFGTSHFRIP